MTLNSIHLLIKDIYLQTEFIEKYDESVTYLKCLIVERLPASLNLDNDVTAMEIRGLCFT